jgi:hypothetical protein
MIERTDTSGRWESADGGRTWSLVEPSAEFIAEHANAVDPEPEPSPEERIAQLEAIIAALIEEAP